MKPTLADNILVIFYFMMWVLVFIMYHKKNRQFDGGSVIIGSYICYAFFSILTLNRPITFFDYYEFNHLTLFPFIYLFVMLIIALSPAIVYHFHPANQIENPNTRIFYLIAVSSILSALFLLPDILMNLGDGFLKLMTDMDAGKDAYEEQMENASEAGGGLSNIPAIIFNALTELSIFVFFYFLTLKKKNIWIVSGLGFSILVAVLQPIMSGQRSLVIYTVFTVILGFFYFKEFLSHRVKRFVRSIGILGITMTIMPIIAITVSRFSNMRQSTVLDYVNWYVGQGNLYFNNYALDDNGIRYGDRTFNLLKRVISSDASQNYIERRSTFSNLYINDEFFTTFVGDFTIDFGPVVAFLIFIFFNALVLKLTKHKDGKLKVQQALLLYFTMCICMQGGMTLFTFSDTANLKMICFAFLYIYLVLHEDILAKFPKQVSFVWHYGNTLPSKEIVMKRNRYIGRIFKRLKHIFLKTYKITKTI